MKRERWEDTAGRKKWCGADVQTANQSNIDINEQAIISKVDPNKLISEAICHVNSLQAYFTSATFIKHLLLLDS